MKNKSLKYPFGTLEDKMFDSNKDGELDSTETIFRDCHLDEMERKSKNHSDSENKNSELKKYTNSYEDTPEPLNSSVSTNEKRASDGMTLFFIFLSLVILVGAIVLAFKVNGNFFAIAALLLGAVGISLLLFKSVGLFG